MGVKMAVYEHQQGKFKMYRAVRSVNGRPQQRYFPFTAQGKAQAEAHDAELAKQQHEAQKHFTGLAGRWKRC